MAKAEGPRLRALLFDAYGGFADRRYKKLKWNERFAVLDTGDYDAPSRFCYVNTWANDDDSLRLELVGNVPISEDLEDFISSRSGTLDEWENEYEEERRAVELTFEAGDAAGAVRELAGTVENVVGPGRSYDDPNWKWVAPRVGEALRGLADVVDRL